MNFSVNTAGMGSNAAQVITWVTDAAFLWDLRTNKDFAYGGTTSATTPTSGNALVRMATDWTEWTSYGKDEHTAAFATPQNGGSAVIINPNLPFSSFWQNMLLHELGHSAEFFSPITGSHSPDSDDLMSSGSVVGKFPVSMADGYGVSLFSSLPTVDTADLASAYLDAGNDMYIPDLNVNGSIRQIQLNYDGVVNLGLGAKHTWSVISNIANEEGTGSSGSVSGTSVSMVGVQSQGTDYTSVVMEVVGSQVQLTSWV